MSGIAGIIRFDGGPVEQGLIEKMTSAMPYRGPDGINHWVHGSVALGQCMLRTTAESLEETQPLTNEDESLVLVMDGRVDNWEELRSELLSRGAKLRSRADAELVLRTYEIWGRECLAHIDGDFALVIWDARRNEAFCARDRMGNKPFTYHWDGKKLVFASELHAILAMPWVPQIPNEGMIAEYISDEWFSFDETIWTGVMRLPGAHRMSVGPAGPKPISYWMPNLDAPQPYTKDDDYIEHYRHLFADCVRRLSRSHKSVAYEVSGGLDSSAVFCMAEHLRRSGTLPAPSIDGYTVAFTEYADANELSYARAVGQHLGRSLREVTPCVKDLAWFHDQARFYRDFPGYPGSPQNCNLYAQAAAAGSRVVLTGMGGDQFVYGSRAYYAEELAELNWANVYGCFKNDVRTYGVVRTIRLLAQHGLLPLLPRSLKILLRPLARRLDARISRGAYWLSPSMKQRLIERRARRPSYPDFQVRHRGQLHLLQALYYPFDARGRELCERLGARCGFEFRQPYNASAFVQFAFVTPERLRSRGAQAKYIHIKALEGILPQQIRDRITKADFAEVVAANLLPLEREMTTGLPRSRPTWLDQAGMSRLFRSYVGSPDEGWQVWALSGILGCDLAVPRQNH